jgi:hypothetical protein
MGQAAQTNVQTGKENALGGEPRAENLIGKEIVSINEERANTSKRMGSA